MLASNTPHSCSATSSSATCFGRQPDAMLGELNSLGRFCIIHIKQPQMAACGCSCPSADIVQAKRTFEQSIPGCTETLLTCRKSSSPSAPPSLRAAPPPAGTQAKPPFYARPNCLPRSALTPRRVITACRPSSWGTLACRDSWARTAWRRRRGRARSIATSPWTSSALRTTPPPRCSTMSCWCVLCCFGTEHSNLLLRSMLLRNSAVTAMHRSFWCTTHLCLDALAWRQRAEHQISQLVGMPVCHQRMLPAPC